MKKSIKITLMALMVFIMGFCLLGSVPSSNYQPVYAAVYSQGSSGSTVRTIQQKLKNWGYYKGSVDGIFGSKTKEAVKYFQRKNKLTVDGKAGPKTLKAMGISTSSSSSSNATSSYSDADVALLARLIHGEARGESYVGQVAVGAVVLNRVKSSSFPNTISGVIYQKYAFTAVADGQINLTPNATAKKAAQDALNGWDPSYGSLYYYNPKVATSSWIFSRPTVVTIGNHVFAK
jgi:N-acetylmuramoyl-L-alanine amidase